MTRYSAYIEIEAPGGTGKSIVQTIDEALEETEIERAATGYNKMARTIHVRYNVNTEGPQEAIELGWCECVPCFKCRIPTGLDELSHGICPDCLRLGTRFGV